MMAAGDRWNEYDTARLMTIQHPLGNAGWGRPAHTD
jgi:hypothetical protein